MPRRKNFASASPAEIAHLAFNSALKHSLDNLNGTTLGTVKYILKKTKSVNMFKYASLIEGTLSTAVADGKLILDDSGWYKWPDHEYHYRLRRERLERQREIRARSTEVTSLPNSATGSTGNAVSSPNSAERLSRKRKRKSKRGAVSSNDALPDDSAATSSYGESPVSTHSLTYNDHPIASYDGESNQKKEASMEYQYEGVETKVIATNVQGSASAPLLSTGKLSETVNARETSSWDTPSKVTEPIKSLAVLEDAICGIGDQPSTKESKIDHQIPSYDGESNQKKEASMEYQYEGVETKGIATTVQGSASAPLLSTGKLSETVNARETSSWDIPSKVTEPIKSLAVLKDAICGIGDRPSTKEMYRLFGMYRVNSQQREIKESDVHVAGGSNLTSVSNQVSPLQNHEIVNKKKKRDNKSKRSETQHDDNSQAPVGKKHSDIRLHKGNRFKKN